MTITDEKEKKGIKDTQGYQPTKIQKTVLTKRIEGKKNIKMKKYLRKVLRNR